VGRKLHDGQLDLGKGLGSDGCADEREVNGVPG
jgi:hypothetical protein